MAIANPVETGCGSAGMPSTSANKIKHAAFSNARRTPIQKFPTVAAVIIPTPISPKVNIGPLASTWDEHAVEIASMAKTGTATPVSTAVHQARAVEAGASVVVKGGMAKMLTETLGNPETLYSIRSSGLGTCEIGKLSSALLYSGDTGETVP